MRDDQELSLDQLSAVIGGATNNGSSMSNPAPPVDKTIIKWILDHLFK